MKHWISDRYGSRRGFIRAYWHRVLYLLGKYRTYQQIEWDSVDRLVFVCKGNICRSAFAEAVARSSGIDSISCGIDTVSGAPAYDAAIDAATVRNIDLREHRTTPLQSLSFGKRDLLIVMEPLQIGYLEQNLDKENMFTLLGLWGKPLQLHRKICA
jgi:protein-tyrosine phosphatase